MHPILLYDGVCRLCNRLVQFILRHDRQEIFRFVSLQSALAAQILTRHGADPHDLDTIYVVLNYEPDAEPSTERLLARFDATIFILSQLGGAWSFVAGAMRIIPISVRDWGYRVVARYRYRLFGRYDSCLLPSPETRDRFLDI
jgi:predicted DCC family thiol-disulfide oxidoreductase YuxK